MGTRVTTTKDGVEYHYSSFYENEFKLYEQCNPTILAEYDRNTKEISYASEFNCGEFKLRGISGNALDAGVVLLPNDAEEYGDEAKLLEEIQAFIHKYLDIRKEMEVFASYYVLLSWVYDKFNTVPYLRAIGDTGSGKSRFLTTIGRICYKPIITGGATTAAPIFRMIENWKGTLVLDEADFKESDTTADIIKILNCGFEEGTPVLRCDKENPSDVEAHRVYGPKVIATRQSFGDKALESRCLTERMRQTARKDISFVLGKEFKEEAAKLRSKLLMYRFRNYDKISTQQPVDISFAEPRLQQATASFAQLVAGKPELAVKFQNFMRDYQREIIQERAETMEGIIINAIHELKEAGVEHLTTKLIAEHINEERGKDEQVKAYQIGRKLRPFGITLHPMKVEGKFIRALMLPDDMEEHYKRYVLPIDEVAEVAEVSLHTETATPDIATTIINFTALPVVTATSATGATKVLDFLISNPGRELTAELLLDGLGADCHNIAEVKSALEELEKRGEIREIKPGVFVYG